MLTAVETFGQAQSAPERAISINQIEQLIRDLASTDFRTRKTAEKTLATAGDDAI